MKNIKRKDDDQQFRKFVLTIKITAEEKRRLTEFAAQNSVNLSALVRKLLFERLEKDEI